VAPELFFHAGLNKAGSTYLQDALRLNSGWLASHSVHYPKPMTSVGAGNADTLSLAVRDGDEGYAKRFLARRVRDCVRRKCKILLLSTELLYHQLVIPEKLAFLDKLLSEAGIGRRRILLYFREPVSHAISAYCHRAGTRILPTFSDWVTTDYEGPAELERFLGLFDGNTQFEWVPRTYSSDHLAEDFCEALGVPPFPTLPARRANVSVSADEAEILRTMALRDLRLAKSLRGRFKQLPREHKANDVGLRSLYEIQAAEAILAHASPYERLSSILGSNLLETAATTSCSELEETLVLSDFQRQTIQQTRAPSRLHRFWARLISTCRRRLVRIRA
jgi:hypothetical protein